MEDNKRKKFEELKEKIKVCERCCDKQGEDIPNHLINIFSLNLDDKIPTIWTDWRNRLEAKIMMIGQDWGPLKDMLCYQEECEKLWEGKEKQKEQIWEEFVSRQESTTNKRMTGYMIESAKKCGVKFDKKDMKKVYVTNAILCARKGSEYRGSKNCKVDKYTEYCSYFLKEQIKIVQPTVILTLGYYPLKALSQEYSFPIEKTLEQTILKLQRDVITIKEEGKEIKVIPTWHPVAQIKRERQIENYKKIWRFVL